jgi:hypothetical protein
VPVARYFAPRRGVYDVAPGLSRLGTPWGNGRADDRLFQFDHTFPRYRANKLRCRREGFGKYVLWDRRFADGDVAETVARRMAARLCDEHPDWFAGETAAERRAYPRLRPDPRAAAFRRPDALVGVEVSGDAPPPAVPPYRNAFDALCCQVPEDVAVVVRAPERGARDANAALHVCAPSRWAPAEKVGRSFAATHGPVPHFAKVARASDALLKQVLHGEPVTRLNWGVEPTDRLNLHPEPPPDVDPAEGERGAWERDNATPIFLRVERQALWGLPEAAVVVFTIRVYVYPTADLSPDERLLLAAGLRSMSPQTLSYKGLTPAACDALTFRLETGPQTRQFFVPPDPDPGG